METPPRQNNKKRNKQNNKQANKANKASKKSRKRIKDNQPESDKQRPFVAVES